MAMTHDGAVKRWGPWPDRFWNRVDKIDGGCWTWTGTMSRGYGVITNPATGKMERAHRVAYELVVGPIPDGLVLDHLCRNTRCINPAHLEPVAARENQRRGLRGELTTHCPRGHAYTPENTRIYRGSRHCKTCHREQTRARRHARQDEAGA